MKIDSKKNCEYAKIYCGKWDTGEQAGSGVGGAGSTETGGAGAIGSKSFESNIQEGTESSSSSSK